MVAQESSTETQDDAEENSGVDSVRQPLPEWANYRNWLLSLASILLVLGALEILTRFLTRHEDALLIRNLQKMGTAPPPSAEREARLSEIVQRSTAPDIIYELQPNISTVFLGVPVQTNSLGFRGPEIVKSKDENTVRIIGLGDSVMFGWGVEEEETYLRVLERRLNLEYPSVNWEFINTGVPGYNAAMEAETLHVHGLELHPDIVIIHYLNNDFALPNFIGGRENYLTFRKSFLWTYVMGHLKEIDRSAIFELSRAPVDEHGRRYAIPDKVPKEYAHMVGAEGYRSAITKLKQLSDEHGFQLFIFAADVEHTFGRDEVEKISDELRIPLITINSWHTSDLPYSMRYLSESDPHPTPLGHELIAKDLFQYFEDHVVHLYLGDRSTAKVD